MPKTGEPALNLFLAQALDRRHPRWQVSAEQTRTVHGEPGRRPDILIAHSGGQPIVIETEVEPAPTVEADAAARLRVTLETGGQAVEQAVALRIPEALPYVGQQNLADAVEQARYQYATLRLDAGGNLVRQPRGGWLEGGVDDLADLCENISLSEQALAAGDRKSVV